MLNLNIRMWIKFFYKSKNKIAKLVLDLLWSVVSMHKSKRTLLAQTADVQEQDILRRSQVWFSRLIHISILSRSPFVPTHMQLLYASRFPSCVSTIRAFWRQRYRIRFNKISFKWIKLFSYKIKNRFLYSDK